MLRDIRIERWRSTLVLAFVLCVAVAGLARADGGGNSNSQTCPSGQVYDKRTGACVRQQAGVLPDAELAAYAVALAKAKRYDDALGVFNTMQDPKAAATLLPDADRPEYALVLAKADRYAEALQVLDAMENPNTPVALNYRGYVTRHLGRVDRGIGYYYRALELDPRYAQAREYLGEAYVIKGELVKAKYELSMIKWICGNTQCDEYADLKKAIDTKVIEN